MVDSLTPPVKVYKATERNVPQQEKQREHHAEKRSDQTERHRRSVAKKPGRPRKKRQRGGSLSQGKYPFMALLNAFLAQRKISWSETTYKERERKYRYICRVFRELKAQGRTDTVNPLKFTEREIYSFEAFMQQKSLDPATRAKYRGMINDFLKWNENYVYEKLICKGFINTQRPDKEIKTISHQEFQTLLNYARQNRKTWSDHVAYFMSAMCGYMALRHKELRLANIEDLDLKHWTFVVAHPKGESRYGKKRALPVVQPLRPIIQEFLAIRDQHIKDKGLTNVKPLLPSITKYKGKVSCTHYTGNTLRRIAKKLSKGAGVDFHIKTLRASAAQNLKDMGADIETVSKYLGHSSTEVTEKFYARLRDEAMFSEINSLYTQEEGRAISHLIKKERHIPGYA